MTRSRVLPLAPLACLVALVTAAVAARALRAPPPPPPAPTSARARAECTGTGAPAGPAGSTSPTGPASAPLAEPATRPPGVPRLTGPAVGAGNAGLAGNAGPAGRGAHGGPRRTHRAWAAGPRAGRARVVFAVDVGGAVATEVATAPDASVLYASTLGGDFVALERDGRVRFRVPLGNDDKGRPARSYASPVVAEDGTIYVGSDAGKLFVVTKEGKVRHTIDLGDEVDVSPLLLPNGVVVAAAGKRVAWIDGRGNVTHRIEAKKKVYTAPALASAAGSLERALVVFGAQDDHVYGVRATTGEPVFRTPVGADVDGSPAVFDDGTFVVGTDGGEIVRLALDGRVLGRTAVGGFVRGPLSIARNGDVVVGTYGPAPKVVRVRGDAVVGAFPIRGTGAKEHGIHGGPLEDAAGTLYFGTQDDHVYGVATNGDLVFDFPTGGDVDGPLTLLPDGTLVVPSEDGKIYAIAPDEPHP